MAVACPPGSASPVQDHAGIAQQETASKAGQRHYGMLPKNTNRENTNRFHHIRLIQDVSAILPASDIRALTLTREFVAGKSIDWREQNRWKNTF